MFLGKLIFLWIFGVIFVVSAANALKGSEKFAAEPLDRIVNGRNASRGQFPYQVSLRLVDGRHFCSGSILNIRWVVTTGVCVLNLKPPMIIIHAGAHHRTKLDGIPYLVNRIELHNQFHRESLRNDVALIRTAYPFVFVTPRVRPIALPRRDSRAAGVSVTVSGWGYVKVFFPSFCFVSRVLIYFCFSQLSTNKTQAHPDQLQFFHATTITNQDCQSAYSILGRFVHPTKICTAPIPSGLCYEDYGNPMVSGAKPLRRELIGIASWFVPCARGRPDVYVRIHSFVPWIKSIISQIE